MTNANVFRIGKLAAATAVLATCLITQSASAGTITIDFNAIDASGGTVTGAPVTNYLAGFGVTTPDSVAVYSSSVNAYVDSPTTNVFTANDGSRNPTSFTLNFTDPVSDLSFVRAGNLSQFSPSGTIKGPWTATVYDSSNNALASVSEGLIDTFSTVPYATFNLDVTDISRITFVGYDFGFAGSNVPAITDISFTTADVPVPGALALLGFGLIGMGTKRRRLKSA